MTSPTYHDSESPSRAAAEERFGQLAVSHAIAVIAALQAAGGIAHPAIDSALIAALEAARAVDSMRDDGSAGRTGA